jgi:hypothetical protein
MARAARPAAQERVGGAEARGVLPYDSDCWGDGHLAVSGFVDDRTSSGNDRQNKFLSGALGEGEGAPGG